MRENIGIAVRMLLLSCLQVKIYVFPEWRPPSWISDFRLRRTVFPIVLLDTLPRKHGGSHWNFVAIMSTSRDIRISRLEAAILDFWLPVMPDSIPNSTVGFLVPENMGNFVPILSRSWDLAGWSTKALHFFQYRFTWEQNLFEMYVPKDVEVSSPQVYGSVSEKLARKNRAEATDFAVGKQRLRMSCV